MDVTTAVMERVYEVLININANTSPSYPPGLFGPGTPPKLPITVYEVETVPETVLQRRERRTQVTVRVDHFAATITSSAQLAARAREALLEIIPDCDMDTTGRVASGLYRRSQRFTGLLDTHTGIIYKR